MSKVTGSWLLVLLCFSGLFGGSASGLGVAYAASPSPVPSAAHLIRIVAIGDSLTEGYGVPREQAYPAQLARKLQSRGHSVEVVNAGISGSRSSGAAGRVRWALKSKPDIIILELGANDALGGAPVAEMKKNLAAAIEEAQRGGVKLLLAGMKAPPNLGEEYCRSFEQVFPALARKYHVPLIPFFLEGVAGDPRLNQTDLKHPTPEGYVKVVDGVLRHLEPML